MTDGPTRPLAALSAHARDVAAVDRARLAEQLLRQPPAGVLLITCHRVEAYARADDPALERASAVAPDGVRRLDEAASVRHLVGVAVGRDSAVLGEDQILHQLRGALEEARGREGLDPRLERLTTHALGAGRVARSWQQRRRRSLGDVAVATIHARAGRAEGPLRILVVGAGTIGQLAVRSALAAGTRVTIANRTRERADALAATTGADTVAFDPGPLLGEVDGVVVAIDAAWSIGPEAATALIEGRAIVVDLAFPPAVGSLATKLGDRYVSADALARAATEDETPALGARLDRLIERTVAAIEAWSDRDGSRETAAALVRRADDERARELARLWQRVPSLDDDTRAAIEDMTKHLADRLLRPPLERLGRDRDDRATAAIRDLFAL